MKLRTLLGAAALFSASVAASSPALAVGTQAGEDEDKGGETPGARCAKVLPEAECPPLLAMLAQIRRPQSDQDAARYQAEFEGLSAPARRWLVEEFELQSRAQTTVLVSSRVSAAAAPSPARERANVLPASARPAPAPRARGPLEVLWDAVIPRGRSRGRSRQHVAVEPSRGSRPAWLKVGH